MSYSLVRFPTWVGESTVPILSGSEYIPFRVSLSQNIANDAQKNGAGPLKIAVVAGGSDPYKLVFEIAKILVELPELFEAYLFSNSSFDGVLDSRFHFIKIGQKLDEVIRDVDLVFTTSSTSSLEFIAHGLPVGVACAVDNQEQYYKSLGELGAAAQIGFRNLLNEWELDPEKIRLLVTSSEIREGLIAKTLGLIDFKGARRIVDAIKSL